MTSSDRPSGLAATACAAALLLGACGEGTGGEGGGGGGGPATGRGGSTARMAIVDDTLYAVSGDAVQLFDIGDASGTPLPWTRVTLGRDVRSLLPHGDHLIVGGIDGVYVMDNTDPADPREVATLPHVTATSPVAASGSLAYVSMRADYTRPPPAGEDRLEVLDLGDITAPEVVRTVSMRAPAGLAVRGDRLYVCDGDAGLKTFDLSDPTAPRVIGTVVDENCDDMIVSDDLLHVVAADGLRQYDLTTGGPLLLSEIGRAPVVYVVDR